MRLETSKKLCLFFAVANLGLFTYNHNPFNLYVGIAMCSWVVFLEFLRR
jgi:hypothetical protein